MHQLIARGSTRLASIAWLEMGVNCLELEILKATPTNVGAELPIIAMLPVFPESIFSPWV